MAIAFRNFAFCESIGIGHRDRRPLYRTREFLEKEERSKSGSIACLAVCRTFSWPCAVALVCERAAFKDSVTFAGLRSIN